MTSPLAFMGKNWWRAPFKQHLHAFSKILVQIKGIICLFWLKIKSHCSTNQCSWWQTLLRFDINNVFPPRLEEHFAPLKSSCLIIMSFSRWQLNSLNELKMVKKNCCWMERSNWEGVFKCSVKNWHSGSQLTAAATPFRSHKKITSTEVQPPDNMSNIKSNILGSCCIQAIIHIYIYWYVRKVQHKHRKKKYCNNK